MANIAKYLQIVGWEVTVITPSLDLWRIESNQSSNDELKKLGVTIIQTRCRRKILLPQQGQLRLAPFWNNPVGARLKSLIRSAARALRIDKMSGWYPEVEKAAEKFKPGSFDIVMASGNPYRAFGCAAKIAKKIQCSSVFDYRDLWSGNPHMRAKKKFRDYNREKALLERCDAVTVVSPSMKKSMHEMFGIGHKIHVIQNGYDRDEYTSIEATEFDHIAIVYAGQFIAPNSTPEPIMKALQRLVTDEHLPKWKFHYMGPNTELVGHYVRQYELENYYVCHGNLPRETCLANIKGASLAIVIASVKNEASLAEKGIITGKVFEPLAMRVPVLAIAPEGADITQVVEGNGWTYRSDQTNEMADAIHSIITGQSKDLDHNNRNDWQNISTLLSESLLKLNY